MNKSRKTCIKHYIIIPAVILILSVFGCAPDPLQEEKAMEKRINDIVSQMTLVEKVFQLCGDYTSFATMDIERLKLQGLQMADGPHGVRVNKSTCFPSSIMLGSTWDPDLMYKVGEAMGKEFRDKGKFIALAPCINVIRDPRGGRSFETFGEDPYLISRMATSIVKGIQSQKVVAVVKHFACNNQENGRFTNNVVVTEDVLREIYLPAFKATVLEGKAWGMMAAYNKVNGDHCSANKHLLTDILKNEWGFKGFVVSDWGATHATRDSLDAGQDIEMPTGKFWGPRLLREAKDGKVDMARLDDAVKRTLRVRYWAGVLDSRLEPANFFQFVYTNGFFSFLNPNKDVAKEAALKGIVLLKNENSFLPLKKSEVSSIAVIGPNGDIARTVGGGSSYVDSYYSISPLEGIRNMAGPGTRVEFVKGCLSKLGTEYKLMDAGYISASVYPDFKGFKAEYYNNKDLSGQPALERTDDAVNFVWGANAPAEGINADNFSVRWTGTITAKRRGEHILQVTSDDGVRLFANGKEVISAWEDQSETVKTGRVFLERDQKLELKLEYHDNTGDALVTLTWSKPPDPEVMINEAKYLASHSDMAVCVVGTDETIESEGFDRRTLKLSLDQDKMITEVASVNPNTIVVIVAGPGVFMDPWLPKVKSVVYLWFAGQEMGNALAEVLFGGYNPGGKLTVTFPKSPDVMPPFNNTYETLDEGRGYRYYADRQEDVLFPFGFGLSYTSFEYGGLKETGKNLSAGEELPVMFTIKNTGLMKGDEIAQLYVRQKDKQGYRGVAKLKGFSRITLNPGETKNVTLNIKAEDLAYYNTDKNRFIPEPGTYEWLIGASYTDIKMKGEFELK
ncbi:MAG: glycoside hydrolase family 3 C-terminal domain-containing protein [Spirochaetales bacterium]|nr:glycoside hydrolase family 3 C-terminal domain-containing protein [Spirochaetales bacterium]